MFDRYLIKNKTQKLDILEHSFKQINFKIKGYKMKLSKFSLLATTALIFTGCALDDTLNSVTRTIDSITTTNKTNNISNKYNLEVKNLSTVAQVENFCKNSPDGISYIITTLPDLKEGQFAGDVAEILLVTNSKIDIEIEAISPREYMNYRNKAFTPEYDPRNPKQKVKLIKPIMVYKTLGRKDVNACKLEYSEPR